MSTLTIKSRRSDDESLRFEWPDTPPNTKGKFVGKVVVVVDNPIIPRITKAEVLAAVEHAHVWTRDSLQEVTELTEPWPSPKDIDNLTATFNDMGTSLKTLNPSSPMLKDIEEMIAGQRKIREVAVKHEAYQPRLLSRKRELERDFDALSRLKGWLAHAPLEIHVFDAVVCDEPPKMLRMRKADLEDLNALTEEIIGMAEDTRILHATVKARAQKLPSCRMYTSPPSGGAPIEHQIEDVRKVMRSNPEKIDERDRKLDALGAKAEKLNTSAKDFARSVEKLTSTTKQSSVCTIL